MPRVAIFADFIKIVTIFIKAIFKDSKKVKRILERKKKKKKCNLKMQSISVFLHIASLLIFGEKC